MAASERAGQGAAPPLAGAGPLAALDGRLRDRLALARRAAEETSTRVAWVGGGVRDAIAGDHPASDDIDLVVEGDFERFAARYADLTGARRTASSAFLTVALEIPEEARIDVARARRESYPAPGALPRVEAASDLETDLRRRDFTVNSMAIVLGPEPALLDPTGGRADLASRSLRVHHERSFLDDPTRVYRGIDFEARLGLRFESETERLARRALASGAVATLSGARLRNVLTRAFGRRRTAAAAWTRTGQLGAVAAIAPALAWSAEKRVAVAEAIERFEATASPDAATNDILLLALGALLADSSVSERTAVADRLGLDARSRSFLVEGIERVSAAARLAPEISAGVAHRSLAALGELELALLAARGASAEVWARRERGELRRLRLAIDGGDLVQRGIPPGPAIGQALARTLEARLDGRITAAEELEFALAEAKAEGGR